MLSFEDLVRKSVACTKSVKVCVLVLLVMSFASVTFQVPFVRASPLTINVSPATASVGNVMTISGVNASSNGEVRMYVVIGFFFASTTANDTGEYSVDFTVPRVPYGTYQMSALDVASGDTASTTFSVEPKIVLSPSEGGVTSVISVKGDGFYSDSDISMIDFNGTNVTPLPLPHTDSLGSFTASFNVPTRPNGTYSVTVKDQGGAKASAVFRIVPTIVVLSISENHNPGSLVAVQGYGFGVFVNVTIFFGSIDVTPYPFYTTWFDGSFGIVGIPMVFFVPDVADGIYTINATDANGNTANARFPVPGPTLMLTPDRTSQSSIVTAHGLGFVPNAPILLYLESISMTSLIDLIWMSPNLMAAPDGSLVYSFVMPVTAPGVYTVAAYMIPGPGIVQPIRLTSANLLVIDDSPLNVAVNVGSVHFRGEIAEFYVQTASGGKSVNATISKATLYYSNGTLTQDLISDVESVASGLYRIPYIVPGDAPLGAYDLVVEANYAEGLVEALGVSSGSFLLSPGFTGQNAQMIDVQSKIGTIVIPDLGVIKANLTTINARLVSVDGKEATIQSDIGTLKTSTNSINAKVTSIDGNTATISSDVGTIKSDLGNVKSQVTTTGFQLSVSTMVLSLIAAAAAIFAVMLIRKLKSPTVAKAKVAADPSPVAAPIAEETSTVSAEPKSPPETQGASQNPAPSSSPPPSPPSSPPP